MKKIILLVFSLFLVLAFFCIPIYAEAEDTHQQMSPEDVEKVKNMYNENIGAAPAISRFFANERINLYIEGMGEVFFETVNGTVDVAHPGFEENQTLNMFTDSETVDLILAGNMTVTEALEEGRIEYDGEGFFKSVKFGFAKAAFWVYTWFD